MIIKRLYGKTKLGNWNFICNIKDQDIQVHFKLDTYVFRPILIEPFNKRLRRHNGFLDVCKKEILSFLQDKDNQDKLLSCITIYELLKN